MTIWEMERKMPLGEMFAWMKFYGESAPAAAPPALDLNSATPDQLREVFK